jgi:hypothetical protein
VRPWQRLAISDNWNHLMRLRDMKYIDFKHQREKNKIAIICSYHASCLIIETKTYIIVSIKGNLIGRAVIMYVETFKAYIIVSIKGSLIGWAVIMYVETSYQTSFDTNNNVCFRLPLLLTIMYVSIYRTAFILYIYLLQILLIGSTYI